MALRGLGVLLVVPPCQVCELNITTDPAGASMTTSSGWEANGSFRASCGRTARRCVAGTTLVAPFSTLKSSSSQMELQTYCYGLLCKFHPLWVFQTKIAILRDETMINHWAVICLL